MEGITVTDHEITSYRSSADYLSPRETDRILRTSLANRVLELDNFLGDLAFRHSTTKGVLLLRARDAEGRNAVHHAAIGHSAYSLKYLLSAYELFPNQPALHQALFHTKTAIGENTALYAIRQRCPPAFLDQILALTGPVLLNSIDADGFGSLHCAAVDDAAELITHLIEKYHLDPTTAITTAPVTSPLQTSVFLPVPGDTPLHLAARYNSASAFEVLHNKLTADALLQRNSAGETAFKVATSVYAKAVLAYIDQLPKDKKNELLGDDEDDKLSLISSISTWYETESEVIHRWGGSREYVPPHVWEEFEAEQEKWRMKGCPAKKDWRMHVAMGLEESMEVDAGLE